MKRMSKLSKQIVSAGLSFALVAGLPVANLAAFSSPGLEKVQAASAVTRSSIHDGTILHAFCWNFNTIKEKMPEIAAAGYTAVQTSPINECLAIHPGMELFGDTEDEGRWYYHYQPTDWKIGNYQLGTRDEFKAMCEEADKYGVGVIVDIDPNHTTPVYDQVSDDLKDAAGGEDALYHKGAKVENGDDGGMKYDDRVSVTFDAMGGLPDVDTENEGFQQYFYEFLKDCIDCGADGFRIDTAKHIALPDDKVPEAYAGEERENDFYPNMKSAIDAYGSKKYADLFVYGEVLDGDTSRVAAYQDMLGGTVASNYGGAIRNAASSGNVSAKKLSSYKVSDDNSMGTLYKSDDNKLVTWVESHDNYINDHSYNEVDDKEVILGWAIIAARQAGTPLFFSRPEGSSAKNPWGKNVIGEAGSDIYKAPEVVAVNKFRTEMEGEEENLRNPGNNSSILMIERGNKGVVIINASENDFALDSQTTLLDGTYMDSVEGREGLFSVADGQISGTVPAKSVVVLDKLAEGDYSTLFFHNTDNWSVVTADVDGTVYTCDNQGYNWWKVTVPAKEFQVVFKGGNGESSAKFSITKESGKYMTAASSELYFSKAEVEASLGLVTKSIYFLNTDEWKTVNAYAWTDAPNFKELFGGWPGQACATDEGYWVRADVKLQGEQPFNIIFNGDGGQTANITIDGDSNLYIVPEDKGSDGNFAVTKYATRQDAEKATGIGADSITVYYYNAGDWDKVGVYTWGDVKLGEWPGIECEYEGDGWWKKTINASPSSNFNIIFNNFTADDKTKRQTKDMKADSLKKVYFVGAEYKFASKQAAEEFTKDPEFILEKNLNPELDEDEPQDPEKTVRVIEQEKELKDGEARVYVRLENKKYFEDAYAYIWTDGPNVEYLNSWPGTRMTHIGNCWYSLNVSKEALATEDDNEEENTEELKETEPVYAEDAEETDEVDEAVDDTKESEAADDTKEPEVVDDTKEPEDKEDKEDKEDEEDKNAIDEINDLLTSMLHVFISAFSPMETKAAEHNVFREGVHVIVNNADGFQENDVNSWFTTIRPSAEELKQGEVPKAEPTEEKPVVEPEKPSTEEPAVEPEKPSIEGPTVEPEKPSTEEKPAETQPSQGNTSTGTTTTPSAQASSDAIKAIEDAQTPLAVTPVKSASNDTTNKATNKAANKTKAAEDTKTEDNATEEEVVEEAKTEETQESEETDDTKKTPTSTDDTSNQTIPETETPLGVEEPGMSTSTIVIIICLVAVALAAGGTVLVKRSKK